ncbi:fumarylacetoacetate hydrolase family protein [Mucilaginibacter phyllosphaerae]|uniref:Fumarylacetoacetate (FAA) hydrolase n=1 Tax=Mucilaginibacter phyllosphaerae TaxID=1812349 RepID=A0A4Y8AA16_9SPHI|nr:fumarylacetoacetate hydrolase family protein [Mucilaginibacter phyllosphaerae]MBB3970731.1 fumarylacetoacetate (FAA) hydrolase [Mucilaginibacter phyllosphaerae]TEW64727.1 fumarylacetoacetate hydrolase family protein [Mucilaginibacter phyllosphaerae]GGH20550.1 fumarylacetoacetase [Mucilaginibacter phyllosphaerae]
MKLVSYKTEDREHLGVYINGHIYNLNSCDKLIPDNMNEFLWGGDELMEHAKRVNEEIRSGKTAAKEELFFELMAPVPHPTSCRDGYAFRQHVAAARRNRKVDMIAEFDQYPIFYFTNHNAIQGPGEIECMPDHFQKLDFELEVAVVLNKKGRNIRADEADSYIAGYMIMNDMSARTLQMEEMLLNLGPAKGKDFSTVIGPWLVTPDELEQYKTAPKEGHTGVTYNLTMKCHVNGVEISSGNMADMDWTFAEIIERCAYGCDVLPGDVIGSGTVGTGCFLELNGTGLLNNPNYQPQWLQPNDLVEMEITGLGMLGNIIKKSDDDFSILGLKK